MNTIVVNRSTGYNLAVHPLSAWLASQGYAVQCLGAAQAGTTLCHRTAPGDLDLAWAAQVYLSTGWERG